MPRTFPLQFNYIPYPLWRRDFPLILRPFAPLARRYLRRIYPVGSDHQPPQSLAAMTAYLRRWDLLDATANDLERCHPQTITPTDAAPTLTTPIRIPAQWESLEAVVINWPVVYPPLWPLYTQMMQAIARYGDPVADMQITVPTVAWAHGVSAYLVAAGGVDMARVMFLIVPTDDIWVRDYGPVVGLGDDGSRGVVDMRYTNHPEYPQNGDDEMPFRFAAAHGLPLRAIDLHTEGGNLLTDGDGTLIMTRAIFQANPGLDHANLERLLRDVFDYEKLIITPRLRYETTGHADLLLKLADATTVLVSEPSTPTTRDELSATVDLFQRETNARGQSYHLHYLPTPGLYFNWFTYPIRRSYTNSLTVNGRVLVPVYGIDTDDAALATYADAMPGYEVIPIDCKVGANGGGAVHCMTKEVPSRQ